MHALAAHLRALCDPEVMPSSIVGGVRNSGVEANLLAFPTSGTANCPCKSQRVVVRMIVAERCLRAVEEILPVHERDSPDRIRGRISN